jgi:hypothetical protein
MIEQIESEEAKWYSHISRMNPSAFLWVIRFVPPHKAMTSFFVMPGLISEI